jgi:hypothetical protein
LGCMGEMTHRAEWSMALEWTAGRNHILGRDGRALARARA